MFIFRGLGVHLILLATSVSAAFAVWRVSKPTTELERGEIVIWKAQPEDIQRVVFEAPNRKTTIEVKRDAVGTYFLGEYQLIILPGEDFPTPSGTTQMRNDSDQPHLLRQSFVSTKAGLKLVSDLAPLKALLAVGRVPKNQLAEFGLDAPKRRAIVTIRNVEHRLEFGDETLGEKQQYVLDPRTEQVYVLLGDLARDISEADTRLPDRDLHAWDPTMPTAARITGMLGARTLARGGPKGNRFWARSESASDKDLTATNWMSKIDQMRPELFDPNAGERQLLLRIDYELAGSKLGFFELLKGPQQKQAQGPSQYWLRTEQTRLPANIVSEQGEQIEQDAKSVLK